MPYYLLASFATLMQSACAAPKEPASTSCLAHQLHVHRCWRGFCPCGQLTSFTLYYTLFPRMRASFDPVFEFGLYSPSSWPALPPSSTTSADICLASHHPSKTSRKELRSGGQRVKPAQAGKTLRCLQHPMANRFSLTSRLSLHGDRETLHQSQEIGR